MTTVQAPLLFMLQGSLSPATTTGQGRSWHWITYGPYADQNEVVKDLMTGHYSYDMLKIIKVTLPLLQHPDHDTVTLDELTEEAEVCELTDEPDNNAGDA